MFRSVALKMDSVGELRGDYNSMLSRCIVALKPTLKISCASWGAAVFAIIRAGQHYCAMVSSTEAV